MQNGEPTLSCHCLVSVLLGSHELTFFSFFPFPGPSLYCLCLPHVLQAIDFDAREKVAALARHTKKIGSVTVLLKRHLVPETQKPIAPVSKENVLEKLAKQHKIELKPEQLDLAAPIDRYGKFELPVSIEGRTTLLHINITQR